MDSDIGERVKQKLIMYKLDDYDLLDERNKERLIRIEKYISSNIDKIDSLIKEIKELRLNKVNIANKNEIGISRKTIYNNDVINKYIDFELLYQPDVFNEIKIQNLKHQYDLINEEYNKLLINIIETKLLEYQLEQYKKEIKALVKSNETKSIIIKEKDQKIAELKNRLSIYNNISSINNKSL
jgi:hypothetical protein